MNEIQSITDLIDWLKDIEQLTPQQIGEHNEYLLNELLQYASKIYDEIGE